MRQRTGNRLSSRAASSSTSEAGAARLPQHSSAARTDDIVIGLGVNSSGKFTTAGSICVDGILTDADVDVALLSVSRGGEFHGKANVQRAEIFGTLCGEVTASDQIVLRSSAIVSGKLSAPYIVTHRGAAVSDEVISLERSPELQLPPSMQVKTNAGFLRRPRSPMFMIGMLALAASGGAALVWLTGRSHEQPAVTEARVIP